MKQYAQSQHTELNSSLANYHGKFIAYGSRKWHKLHISFLFQIVRSSIQTDCKCHGVSGSCNVKTCWRALPRLREIGERLKRHYYIATEVVQRQVGSRRKLMPTNGKLSMYQKNDLIFVFKSPDYCLKDDRVGSPGTQGR